MSPQAENNFSESLKVNKLTYARRYSVSMKIVINPTDDNRE